MWIQYEFKQRTEEKSQTDNYAKDAKLNYIDAINNRKFIKSGMQDHLTALRSIYCRVNKLKC